MTEPFNWDRRKKDEIVMEDRRISPKMTLEQEGELTCPLCKMSYPISKDWGHAMCPYCSAGASIKLIGATHDMVDKPLHYQVFPEHGVEAMDIILRIIQLAKLDERQSYLLGNALKYLLRLGRKGDVKEDAGKAEHYIRRLKND